MPTGRRQPVATGSRSPSSATLPADVDQAWKELTEAGHRGHLAPWDAVWGMRYAVVHDPDGTPVDLFAALPPSP
jgi:uncharacterized glyoxalase superfamily protein PhnB